MVKTIDEFKGMNPKDVVSYIEGEPFISVVVKTNYNNIKRVFSIWVCMNMDENSMDYVHLTDDKLLGSFPLDDRIREDVSEMCNLSQGIREKGRAEGRDEREQKIILNMHRKGFTSEQIAEIVEKSVSEVEAVIKKREPVLA